MRFKNIEKENPVIASTFLSASIGSLVGKPTGSTFILSTFRLLAFAKGVNCAHAPSGGGAPRTDPSKSLGPLIPNDFLPITAKGGLS